MATTIDCEASLSDDYDLLDEEFDMNDLPDVQFDFEEEDASENIHLDCENNEGMLTEDTPITSNVNGACDASSKKKKKAKSKKDKVMKDPKTGKDKVPRKKAVARPEMKFKMEDAITNATTYVESALNELINHPVYKTGFPAALAAVALASTLLGLIASPIVHAFSQDLVKDIWVIITAGDKKKIKPEANELVYRQYHLYVTCSSSKEQWANFLQSLNLTPNDHVHHFLLRTLLRLIMADRNSADLPEKQNTEANPLDKSTEEVIRYTAGYVPYALHKRYSKVKGETAKVYCALLSSWKVQGTNNSRTFLEYTNGWLKKQTRGGLFEIKDNVYLFFRTLEIETRKHLTVSGMNEMPNKDMKSCIMHSIGEKQLVHTYWCTITANKIAGDVSKRLLDDVIKLWIKIRTNAFLKVYLDLKRAEGKSVPGKSAKALRKDL